MNRLHVGSYRTIIDASDYGVEWRIVRVSLRGYQLFRWLDFDEGWYYFGQYRSYIAAVRDTETPE